MMVRLPTLLYRFFIHNRALSVENIGTVRLAYSPASFDAHSGMFRPREYYYAFSHTVHTDLQDDLVGFLVDRLHIRASEAQQLISQWAENVLHLSSRSKPYHWLNVGRFSRDETGALVFLPSCEEMRFGDEVFVVNRHAQVGQVTQKNYTQHYYVNERESDDQPIAQAAAVHISSTRVREIPQAPTTSSEEQERIAELERSIDEVDIPVPQSVTPKPAPIQDKAVYTEFVELDTVYRYGITQKVFIILLLIGGLVYIFFHLFVNDFSFHSYVR